MIKNVICPNLQNLKIVSCFILQKVLESADGHFYH